MITADAWANRITELARSIEKRMKDATMIDKPMYRIAMCKDRVTVMNFDITDMDGCLDRVYNHVDDLPNWVKERLAILMMTSPAPPTDPIEGVGRRISETIFWVEVPDQGERNE